MDFWDKTKDAFQKAYLSGMKKKLIMLVAGILIFIILVTILVTIILDESDNEKNKTGAYNALASYSFWWPIGGQEITTDEYGKNYAIGEPTGVNIFSDYKDRNPERPDHNGIDINSVDINGVKQGEGYHYIIASKGGTVITSHLSDSAGEYVAIDHGDGFVTKYMHMYEGSRAVSEGDIVKQGQILGLMGNTGHSTGPHLHFQIELNGEVVDPLQYVSAEHSRGGSNISPFGTSISKEEFVQCIQQYSQSEDYQTYMAPYAEDFYNICTEYGVNPQLAFAHSCIETGYGSSTQVQQKSNYFGMGAYNTDPSNATVYDSVQNSIRGYCDWVVKFSTIGTTEYQWAVEEAEKLSQYNSNLIGTPETNIYVLYIKYATLYPTHTEGSDGDPYYWSEVMYGKRCTHEPGSETTLQEQADYAVYTTNLRLNVIQNIFGK